MAQLQLTNVINISVAETPAGIGKYNTSNLALFTRDAYDADLFGDLGYKIYLEPSEVGSDFGTDSITYKMALAVFSQQPNILAGGGYLVIIPFLSSEELADAINRTKDLVQYFGVMMAEIDLQTLVLQAAQVIQSLNKIAFFSSHDILDIAPGGTFDILRSSGYTQSRALFYLGDEVDVDTLVMQAAYAARALSTDFEGSNTTSTMQLKDLVGVLPDGSMTQTYQNQCSECGADTYVSLQGVAKVLTSGANKFFDDVYNLQWFVGALQVAGFNFLAQSATKIPQTEGGMTAFKDAYRQVCEQAVTNQFVAPGKWNSPNIFGNQENFLANIAQRGYYIYSVPVSQQSQVARAAREAPLVQIAIKEAGAIHSANVIVFVNV